MSRTKTSTGNKKKIEIKETVGYKRFKENVISEEPNPYFCQKDEIKYFAELKKEFPDATLHDNTVIGTAICKDKITRFALAYELLGVSKAYVYLSKALLLDIMDAEMEGIAIMNSIGEG